MVNEVFCFRISITHENPLIGLHIFQRKFVLPCRDRPDLEPLTGKMVDVPGYVDVAVLDEIRTYPKIRERAQYPFYG